MSWRILSGLNRSRHLDAYTLTMPRAPLKPSPAEELAQMDACMALAAVGMSYRRISATLKERGMDISHETVRARLAAARDKVILPNLEQAKQASYERLNGLLDALSPAVEAGDVKAIAASGRIEGLIMELFGTKNLNVQVEGTMRYEVVGVEPADLT